MFPFPMAEAFASAWNYDPINDCRGVVWNYDPISRGLKPIVWNYDPTRGLKPMHSTAWCIAYSARTIRLEL